MTRNWRLVFGGLILLGSVGGIVLAQRRPPENSNIVAPFDRKGVPDWPVDPAFKSDLFTFVRVHYSSSYGGRGFRGRGFGGGRDREPWFTDAPDSDLNFSFRLQQLTSLKVDPNGRIIELTDPELFDFPFIYMLEIRSLDFTDEEVTALRRYLLNGGFLMVDDHWGDYEYENFHQQIRRVFPDREPVELALDHQIFHCVYDLKEKPQIPGIGAARDHYGTNITYERDYDPTAHDPHYRAIYDDKGRMMVIICSNTDLGDGWEREGEEEWYFHTFSEKRAYPMGINIIFYAMTH